MVTFIMMQMQNTSLMYEVLIILSEGSYFLFKKYIFIIIGIYVQKTLKGYSTFAVNKVIHVLYILWIKITLLKKAHYV